MLFVKKSIKAGAQKLEITNKITNSKIKFNKNFKVPNSKIYSTRLPNEKIVKHHDSYSTASRQNSLRRNRIQNPEKQEKPRKK